MALVLHGKQPRKASSGALLPGFLHESGRADLRSAWTRGSASLPEIWVQSQFKILAALLSQNKNPGSAFAAGR
jgi:hypothetical protein